MLDVSESYQNFQNWAMIYQLTDVEKWGIKINCLHRVDRVLSFLSSRPNWDSPTPSNAGYLECTPPPPPPGSEGHTRLGEGGGVPIPTRGQSDCMAGRQKYYCQIVSLHKPATPCTGKYKYDLTHTLIISAPDTSKCVRLSALNVP